ncbi:MAG: endonuclease III [Actinomycetota bacterium]|nr:endonuclease III [Actinomycetota bacterium]
MPSDRRDQPASQRAGEILGELEGAYPDARIALDFTTPLECVVATLLSAQSTDKKINEVTSWLFKKYRTPEDYLAVPEDELKEDLKPTGFFNQKTKSVRNLSQKLLDDYGGEVPATMAELITLPGVARKTANIVQSNCFADVVKDDPDAGIAVDTHVGRVAVRLSLTEHRSKDAARIERDLMELFPREKWPSVPNVFIVHGRTTCDAKRPRCEDCAVEPLCPSSQEAGRTDLFRVPKKKTTKKKPAKKTTRKTRPTR